MARTVYKEIEGGKGLFGLFLLLALLILAGLAQRLVYGT